MPCPRPRTLLAALSIAILLPSCVFSIGGGGRDARTRVSWDDDSPRATQEAQAARPAAKGEPKAADPAQRERELAKKRRDLAHAELELSIAEGKVAEQRDGAEQELAKATHGLRQAERELASFLTEARPQTLARGELEVERAVFRVEQRRQDLQQLVDDYAAQGEEFYAKRTGEIVIWRTRRELEMSERALEQQRAALALERDHDLPKKQASLEFALEQARSSLTQAEAKRQRARVEAHLTLEKARAKLADLREELERLERGEGGASGGERPAGEKG